MPTLLIGIAVLLLAFWAVRQFAGANPHVVVQSLRKGGGFAALAGAAFLAATGRFSLAVPLGFLAMGLLDWLPGRNAFGSWARPTPGQTSKVRSAMIEMELDHDSGTMRGTFTAGPHAGTPLEALTPETRVMVFALHGMGRNDGWYEVLEQMLARIHRGGEDDPGSHRTLISPVLCRRSARTPAGRAGCDRIRGPVESTTHVHRGVRTGPGTPAVRSAADPPRRCAAGTTSWSRPGCTSSACSCRC